MATYSTTTAPLPWMEPYLQDYMGRAQDVANTPYQQSPGTYTPANNLLTGGWQLTANRAMQGNPAMNAASGALADYASGNVPVGTAASGGATMNPYANVTNAAANVANPYATMENPYLTQSIQNAQGDLTSAWNNVNVPQWDKAMQQSGSFGNTGVQQYAAMAANDLQKNLGRIGTDARMNAYNLAAQLAENQAGRQFTAGENVAGRQYGAGSQYAGALNAASLQAASDQNRMADNARNRQLQAIGMAPTFAQQDWTDINQLLGAGTAMQGFNQAAQNQQQQWFNEAQAYPQNRLDAYGRALGVNAGGTSTQTAPDPSKWAELFGGAATGAALYNLFYPPPKG